MQIEMLPFFDYQKNKKRGFAFLGFPQIKQRRKMGVSKRNLLIHMSVSKYKEGKRE